MSQYVIPKLPGPSFIWLATITVNSGNSLPVTTTIPIDDTRSFIIEGGSAGSFSNGVYLAGSSKAQVKIFYSIFVPQTIVIEGPLTGGVNADPRTIIKLDLSFR